MITEIIGSEYEGDDKWSGMVKGNDNCLYCLPHNAKQLLKIDPSNDETILVGEEYDGDGKWCNGFARGDCIYLIPSKANRFLKYNIKTGSPHHTTPYQTTTHHNISSIYIQFFDLYTILRFIYNSSIYIQFFDVQRNSERNAIVFFNKNNDFDDNRNNRQ